MSKQSKRLRLALKLTTLQCNSAMLTMDANYPKDPDPKNWRTINGSKVHLTKGKIDGGAGGKFTGKRWNGKQHHQFTPGASKTYTAPAGKTFSKAAQSHLDKIEQIVKQSQKGKGKPEYYQRKIDVAEQSLSALEIINQLYENKTAATQTLIAAPIPGASATTAATRAKRAVSTKAPQIMPGNQYDFLDIDQCKEVNVLWSLSRHGTSRRLTNVIKSFVASYGADEMAVRDNCDKVKADDISREEFNKTISEMMADGLWQKSQEDVAKIQKITKAKHADFNKMSDGDIAEVIKITKNMALPVGLNTKDPTQRIIYGAGWNGLPEITTKAVVERIHFYQDNVMLYRTVNSIDKDFTADDVVKNTFTCPVFKSSGRGQRVYGGGMYMARTLKASKIYGKSRGSVTFGAVFNDRADVLVYDNDIFKERQVVDWVKKHPKTAKELGVGINIYNEVCKASGGRPDEDTGTLLAVAMGHNAVYNLTTGYINVMDRSILTTSNHNYFND